MATKRPQGVVGKRTISKVATQASNVSTNIKRNLGSKNLKQTGEPAPARISIRKMAQVFFALSIDQIEDEQLGEIVLFHSLPLVAYDTVRVRHRLDAMAVDMSNRSAPSNRDLCWFRAGQTFGLYS